eukprot:gb/GECG01001428.1/.p1 GENE.gb/GECG01001428.1/~~gb/GECG01001428.1/.p1  ORF type:complete len:4689 (+),score=693.48 gb/GECG01001428.1/:1-14067(+)
MQHKNSSSAMSASSGEDHAPQLMSPATDSPHKISESRLQKFTAHVSMDPQTKEMVSWVRRKIHLKGFRTSEHWTDDHSQMVSYFLTSPEVQRLVGYMDANDNLVFITPYASFPVQPRQFVYFIKKNVNPITPKTIGSSIRFGLINGGSLESLHRAMHGVFVPSVVNTKTWPEGIKSEFIGQLHRFMASLTETTYHAQGKTVLYLPRETSELTDEAAQNKDLVQRLESTVIHWTRQIKEVVQNQESGAATASTESSGPLEEVEFWRRRVIDLSGISEQLQREGVNRIVHVLEVADSQYLRPYKQLSQNIQEGSEIAKDNLRHLQMLKPICEKLSEAAPAEIPSLLPEILDYVRAIGSISEHYRSPSHIKGLLRKISNQIIEQFRKHIDLDEVFEGDVLEVTKVLEESIHCGAQWKTAYHKQKQAIARAENCRCEPWDFDDAEIFAQVDAFVQRCRDLIEVCEGQIQFARKNLPGGKQSPLPSFGGSKGLEIHASLKTIESEFGKYLTSLSNVKGAILNVKATQWHDVNNMFKSGMRDLEVMLQNVIQSAFEGVSTVQNGVELLESFDQLAKRSAIRKAVEKKTADVYDMFREQMLSLKSYFEANHDSPALRPCEPEYAGAALWARSLQAKIEHDANLLEQCKFLVSSKEQEEAERVYNDHFNAYEEHIRNKYAQWVQSMSGLDQEILQQRLKVPLLLKVRLDGSEDEQKGNKSSARRGHSTGILECNFDHEILRMFREAHYWEKFHGKYLVPFYAADLYNNMSTSLLTVRESVMGLVREYNSIVQSLSHDEQELFSDVLRRLDRKLGPGLNNLTWGSSAAQRDYFLREGKKNCAEVKAVVDTFHSDKRKINRAIDTINRTSLIDIEKNYVHEEGVFEEKQSRHRARVRKVLQNCYRQCLDTLKRMYRFFENDPVHVQKAWAKYVQSVDHSLGKALRATSKHSLQELQRAICADFSKSDVEQSPLFRLNLVLEGGRVEYRPTIIALTQMVNGVAKELITCVSVVKRCEDELPVYYNAETGTYNATKSKITSAESRKSSIIQPVNTERTKTQQEDEQENKEDEDEKEESKEVSQIEVGKESGLPSFYDQIVNDSDILKILMDIMNGMSRSNTELTEHRLKFEDRKYKQLWEKDKQQTFNRFAKKNNSLSVYRTKIEQYINLAEEIKQNETPSCQIHFVLVDHSIIKSTLIDHCVEFQQGYCKLLHENAAKELRTLQEYMSENEKMLKEYPKDLQQLSEQLNRLKQVREEMPLMEARFKPVQDMYNALEEYHVTVPETELQGLQQLPGEWENFKGVLTEVDEQLKRAKTTMKRDLQDDMSSFNSRIQELKGEAEQALPFGSHYTPAEAKSILADWSVRVSQLREREESLAPGLQVFEIPYTTPQELLEIEGQIDKLEQIWDLMANWESSWEAWKKTPFSEIDPESLGQEAAKYKQKVGKLREVKHWPVWQQLEKRIKEFQSTMPLISDLGSSAMRPRHWNSLKREIGTDFDETASDFTLETVFELGLHNYADFVGELSANAFKELSIENSLKEIERIWHDMQIEMSVYKQQYYKISTTEDLFQTLEDHLVNLSTMKASKYFSAFKESINYWEKTLSTISEVVDTQLAVQRQWMYLESIFVGAEDIRRQMNKEARDFDEVNARYTKLTAEMYNDPNAVRACTKEGYLSQLNSMNEKLEGIQKELNDYLEQKRKAFPRFYFVSDADLLEILGQARDPVLVQKHLSKCFMGIKSLAIDSSNRDSKSGPVAVAMNSPDGESVPLESNVILQGAVENWLNDLEYRMRISIRKSLGETLIAFRDANKASNEKRQQALSNWIRDYPGQLLITTGMIMFNNSCERQLRNVASGGSKALKKLVKNQHKYLTLLAAIVRQDLDSVMRKKMIALITMELHSRDVMDRLRRAKCSSTDDFTWNSQLRLSWRRPDPNSSGSDAALDPGDYQYGMCEAHQTSSVLKFGYEYQGNNGRLVITPLTDRCILTLTTALYLNRGGAPAGPAGTGKTETVKDLGKNLAKYVVVFNCSDGLDYMSVGRMFSGLVQSGGWGCFDEFNRIEIEVLSVVAQQVMSIMDAIAQRKDDFLFMGQLISVRRECGIFITMNPGYAGRTELPDNLKSLFRPVAMMVPDMELIAEVMLQAEGFETSKVLAEKIVTLYRLMVQQLSKQDHYDFGLRSMRGVLLCAGGLKRSPELADTNEEYIILRAIRDMNVPKFIKDDKRLFMLLLGDLFPNLELPESDPGVLGEAVSTKMQEWGLQEHPAIHHKVMEVHDCKATRHCNMLVGRTLSGKSTVHRLLAGAKTLLADRGEEGYIRVRSEVINPKSVSLNELYGAYDLQTMEWTDGVLSTVFRNFAKDERNEEKWLILDGPVDTLWIESMNTVMDDNKTLTLINGDRIGMNDEMSLLFEVQDLAVASPATVSRAGMIYVDHTDLGWRPMVKSWLDRHFPDSKQTEDKELYDELFEKYLPTLLEFKKRNCSEIVSLTDENAALSLCRLLDAVGDEDAGNNLDRSSIGDSFPAYLEKWFVFCCTWAIGGAVTDASRRKFNDCLREIEPLFPAVGTSFDYFVDPSSREFKPWTDKLPSKWKPDDNTPYGSLMVPTVDTERNSFIISHLLQKGFNTLIAGDTGTGKTVLVQGHLENMDQERYSWLPVNMSAATTSNSVQDIIEGALEKRAKNKLGPTGGKHLVVFVDDLNMPKKDTYGSQPPLELLRQWIDYGGWYDRSKQSWKYIQDVQLMAAMGPPGGGRTVISERLQSRFNIINFTFPAEKQVRSIFENILSHYYANFGDEMKQMVPGLVQATVQLYNKVVETFLPTPSKSHYLFNMRDISKIVQGLTLADPSIFDQPDKVLRLWSHESMRVLSDRFISFDDVNKFISLMDDQLTSVFEQYYNKLMEGRESADGGPVFTSFMSSGKYQEVVQLEELKKHCEDSLMEYNDVPGALPMELVLFRDALRHICRIHRILSFPRGNALLIGMGGSGRQSLTKLAAFLCDQMSVFQIEITKHYKLQDFREDMKSLYHRTGVDNKPTAFLFSDTQLKEESFLEDINNILSSGEIPNLFEKDEKVNIIDDVRTDARAAGYEETSSDCWKFFINCVRSNLHVVLAMSPIGDGFRNRTRQYPSLVSCTTMDWFHEWPKEALTEVAVKFIADIEFYTPPPESEDAENHSKFDTVQEWENAEQSMRSSIAEVFAFSHQRVREASERMLQELKRHNYVTPTNYLELVKGYRELLLEKRKELSDSAEKLRNGLSKLDESRSQVEVLSKELEEKQETVEEKTRQCDELLVTIVSERRVADEQKEKVESEKERIAREEEICKSIAEDADKDLSAALPALERAMAEVDKLDKSSISEVKAYTSPPALVKLVMEAVMMLFGLPTDWGTAKKKLSEADFLSQVKTFDKDNIKPSVMKKLSRYTKQGSFDPKEVRGQSTAAATLCSWVLAIEEYAKVAATVEPKRERQRQAMEELSRKQADLAEAEKSLQEVQEKVDNLKKQHDESSAEKDALKEQADELATKLDRAEKLVSGLSGEKERWQENIVGYESQLKHLPGDVLVASAFLSYAGPFDTLYRERLVKSIQSRVKELSIPFSPSFSFGSFLAKPTDVRSWNMQGLPADAFSTENGVIVTRGRRWPLMVDPQGQANKWIKNMEGDSLKVTDLKSKDFLRLLEQSISYGLPYLLEDVEEELDPSLEPVLAKAIVTRGARKTIKVGDKELDYSDDFRFYLTTKLSNPHYTPEVSTKAAIVNFAVKEEGLDAQMLSIVVQKEQPELEQQKDELVKSVAKGKNTLVELEDKILYLLSTVEGSLLDNGEIVETLQASKKTSEEVVEQLKISEQTEKKIDEARAGYSVVSTRAALLYFVLNDLGGVDSMYQFSLDSYVQLFEQSIAQSRKKFEKENYSMSFEPEEENSEEQVKRRCDSINEYHTYAVYKWACLGLFENHKLLLSLQICVRTLMKEGKIPRYEWDFFLKGGVVLDRSDQREKPASWISHAMWDNIAELDKLPAFSGIASSLEQLSDEWHAWYMSATPEHRALPSEWETKLNDLQKLIICRCLRQDRVIHAVTKFVSSQMGESFVDPPALNLRSVFEDSSPTIPLVFVLSPGVDPTKQVVSLHQHLVDEGIVDCGLQTCSLGQGQAPIATRYIQEALEHGGWVLLQNCHLSISWMPQLEKIIEDYCAAAEQQGGKAQGQATAPHSQFRLWLTSNPHPKFPISILQRGTKITMQPPRGLKANLLRLYNLVDENEFQERCKAAPGPSYQRLLFSLCWFHAILLERRKFKSLGWNIPYAFNDSDFSICNDILGTYLTEYPKDIPWDAIKYLIAEANYGGRITDDMDRRLCNVYVNKFFSPEVLKQKHYRLSSLEDYYIPSDGDLDSYKDYIHKLPASDPPEAFGQHPNADIQSAIQDSDELLNTVLSLQPKTVSEGGESAESKVLAIAADLEKNLPEQFDTEKISKDVPPDDSDPLRVVLFQELDRYNILLRTIKTSLVDLQKGIQGLVVITSDLEQIFNALLDAKVPEAWSFCYPSLKPLGSWMQDLMSRCAQMRQWATRQIPPVLWLAGFTYPTALFTALLQSSARKNGLPINVLDFEFPIVDKDADSITESPSEGAYIRGLFLEGASWDYNNHCLADPVPMELYSQMPVIHFKPVEINKGDKSKKKQSREMYECPMYIYPIRTGTAERPSFMRLVDLPSGGVHPDFWVLRGTALLLSLSH